MPEGKSTAHWKKWIIAGLALLAALGGVSYFVYSLLDAGKLPPLALLAVAAMISIGLPMLRSNLFPSRRDWETEFAFHEQRLESEITQSIDQGLGPEALNRIFTAPGQFRDAANHAIEQMLAQEEVDQTPGLHFALLVALGRFYSKSGQPESALPALQAALSIKPRHFIARMHLAGNCEWIGAVEEARQHYEFLLQDPRDLSAAMKRLVAAKIKAMGDN